MTFNRIIVKKKLCLVVILFFLINFFIFISDIKAKETIFIMPLGDSITFGDSNGGYRQKLYLDLTTHGLNVNFVGYNDDYGLSRGISLPMGELCLSCTNGDYSCLKHPLRLHTRKEMKT